MIDEAHEWTDSVIDDLEYQLRLQYSEATAEMLDKQSEWLKDYERQKAQYDKDLKEGRITKEEYRKFMQTKAMQSQWFTNMIDSLADGAYSADVRAMDAVNDELPRIYAENHNYGTYQAEKVVGIDSMYTLMDESTVRNLLMNKPDLLPNKYVDKSKDTQWNKEKFNSAVLQSLVQGESIPHMAQRIQSVMDMNYRVAIRNARTAATAAENAGRLASMVRMWNMGIDVRKEWLSTDDHRTRPMHKRSNKEVRELDERFTWTGLLYPGDMSTNDPGQVYNCRCTLKSNFDRSGSKNPVTGESPVDDYMQQPDMDYNEWKEYEGKPVSEKKKEKVKEKAKEQPTPQRYTHAQLNKMKREELVPIAKELFIKTNMENGVPEDEAEHRFNALIESNTTPQLRKFIHNKQG